MNSKAKHIAILCSRLDLPGGTERAIVNLANLFSSAGNKVSILILDETDKLFFPLNNSVSIYNDNLNFGITNKGNKLTRKMGFFNHLRILKRKLNELSPDAVIATEYPFTIAARTVIKNKGIKLFSWEHHHFYWIKRNKFWNLLHKKIYPAINAVVTLNKTEQKLFLDYGCHAVVIPNFVEHQPRADLNFNFLLTVGWLNHRKGVDLISSIAEKIFEKYPNWKWTVIGSSTEEIDLKKLVREKNLSDKIRIIEPVSPDIGEAYQQTSIYVMTSRFECFPMVLLEAMSFGVPCVSFNCPTGPADIIENGIDGILVENENAEAMANAIIGLMGDEEKRKRMSSNAYENVKRFSPEIVYQQWERLFNAE
jgi:glycosyltransferase involved in cell wall biosynthesis